MNTGVTGIKARKLKPLFAFITAVFKDLFSLFSPVLSSWTIIKYDNLSRKYFFVIRNKLKHLVISYIPSIY